MVLGIGEIEIEESVVSRGVPHRRQYVSEDLPWWRVRGSVLGDEIRETGRFPFDPVVRPDKLIELVGGKNNADGV